MAYEAETKRYEDLYDEYRKKSQADVTKAKATKEEEYKDKLKQAYISRKQEEKTLADTMSRQGIRGGATETSGLKLAVNYQGTRNSLQKEKQQTLQDIDTNAANNEFQYKQANDSAKLSYIEQREAEERQKATNDAAEEKASNLDLLSAKYGSVYDVAKLNTAYNAAATTAEKAIILARINYINEHNKGW